MKKTKVSVTIPVYNAEKFIALSIESVLRQDYPFFELIILDDGSTDNTFSVIKNFSEDPRIRIYKQKNKGVGAVRNKLEALAIGKYISPLDADDIMLPGKLRIQAKYLDRHPKVGLVYGKALFIDGNGRRIKANNMKAIVGDYFGTDINKNWDLLFGTVPFGSCMYRKNILKKTGGYNPKLKIDEDIDILFKLAEVTKFHFINRFFYIYRRHSNNISKNKNWMNETILGIKKKALMRRYGEKGKINFLW